MQLSSLTLDFLYKLFKIQCQLMRLCLSEKYVLILIFRNNSFGILTAYFVNFAQANLQGLNLCSWCLNSQESVSFDPRNFQIFLRLLAMSDV